MINLANRIQANNHCCSCGGSYESDACCKYCGEKNDRLEYLLLQLSKVLNTETQEILKSGGITPELSSLYFLRDMNHPMINKILMDNSYQEKVINLQKKITPQSIKDSSFSPQELDFIYKAYVSHDCGGQNEFLYASLVAKNLIMNREWTLPDVDRKKFIIEMTKTFAEQSLKSKYIDVDIVDTLEEEVYGDFSSTVLANNVFGKIRLSKNLFDGTTDFSEIFSTIAHELTHLNQQKGFFIDKALSLRELVGIKDYILSLGLPDYYKNNYANLSTEKEAFYIGYKDAIDYFNFLGVPIPDKVKQGFSTSSKISMDAYSNLERVCDEKVENLDDIFSDFVKNRPEILDRVPQLLFEYVNDNGVVRPKTKEELLNDRENFSNENCPWVLGNGVNLDALYDYKISSLSHENANIK